MNRTSTLNRWIPLLVLPFAAGACDDMADPSDGDVALATATATGPMPDMSPIPADDANARRGAAATYRITVTNISGALQPMTPSVVALHNPAVSLFEVGQPANVGIERIAETGNNGPLIEIAASLNQVFDYGQAFGMVDGGPGPILPGASGFVELHGPPGSRISLVSMLVCTNDGFTGLNTERLPERIGESVTLYADGYDAGTEQNTEAASDLVPPCVMATTGMAGGSGADQPGIAESDVIRHHPGIDADNDGDDILDEEHTWTDPVAEITIERIG